MIVGLQRMLQILLHCQQHFWWGLADHAWRKKAMFITQLGKEMFYKEGVNKPYWLISGQAYLDPIMEKLLGHYRPQTIKITECFKFFKMLSEMGTKYRWIYGRITVVSKDMQFWGVPRYCYQRPIPVWLKVMRSVKKNCYTRIWQTWP